jgi:hypothetical protein
MASLWRDSPPKNSTNSLKLGGYTEKDAKTNSLRSIIMRCGGTKIWFLKKSPRV